MKKIIVKIYGNMAIHTNSEKRFIDFENILFVSECMNMPCFQPSYRVNKLSFKDDITIKGNLFIDSLSIPKDIKIEILCAGTIGFYKDERYLKLLNLYFD